MAAEKKSKANQTTPQKLGKTPKLESGKKKVVGQILSKKEERKIAREKCKLKPIRIVCSNGWSFVTLATYDPQQRRSVDENGLVTLKLTSDPFNSQVWPHNKTAKIILEKDSKLQRFAGVFDDVEEKIPESKSTSTSES